MQETGIMQSERALSAEGTTSYSTVILNRKADFKALALVLPSKRKRHLLREVALEW